jgi:hypothetical protein
LRAENLLNRFFLCDFTVSSDTNNLLAISLPDKPSEINFKISSSLVETDFTAEFISHAIIKNIQITSSQTSLH